jgi:hypothetical protein
MEYPESAEMLNLRDSNILGNEGNILEYCVYGKLEASYYEQGIKRPVREVGHFPPPVAVKRAWSCVFTAMYDSMAWTGETFYHHQYRCCRHDNCPARRIWRLTFIARIAL